LKTPTATSLTSNPRPSPSGMSPTRANVTNSTSPAPKDQNARPRKAFQTRGLASGYGVRKAGYNAFQGTPMSLEAGSRLGPYELVALLGAGGMGEVYRARDTRLGPDVAIKVLPVPFAADPNRLRRFEQEARLACDLMPASKDALAALGPLDGLAQVYTMVGQPGEAIAILDDRLSRIGSFTVPYLRLDPAWDPLRSDPRFQALLTKYAVKRPDLRAVARPPEPNVALTRTLSWRDRDAVGAERESPLGARLNPSCAMAHFHRGLLPVTC